MHLDAKICERARLSRDRRFDGRFFVGVLTTGIFCRPICPARSPKPSNVRFFASAAAASAAGLRPCLRCRPESAPGTPAWSGTSATVERALRQLDNGALDSGSVDELARNLGVGPRHLGRLFHRHLGVSPTAVAQTRRLLFAKKLLNETQLKMADVAFASGFGSVRRFNDLFLRTYGRRPSELRRLASAAGPATSSDLPPNSLELLLPYRPPFDWKSLLAFLAPRAIPGVEEIDDEAYRRNIAIDGASGRIEVRPVPDLDALSLGVDFPKSAALLTITTRVRRLFDLDSDPALVAAELSKSSSLAGLVGKRPGLRVPGAWNGFELAVRAILGQQVTVQGATTLAGRVVEAYGRRIDTGFLFPEPAELVRARFKSVGLPRTRATAIRRLAKACSDGGLQLDPGADPGHTSEALTSLPGIGDWTAQYIAMRALGEPDGFPSTDLGLLKAGAALVGTTRAPRCLTPSHLRQLAEPWRPWRAYAAMHLWQGHAASSDGEA